jgi:hypothetical protein
MDALAHVPVPAPVPVGYRVDPDGSFVVKKGDDGISTPDNFAREAFRAATGVVANEGGIVFVFIYWDCCTVRKDDNGVVVRHSRELLDGSTDVWTGTPEDFMAACAEHDLLNRVARIE